MQTANAGLVDPCIIGWHSMVIRTTGIVAPCCILQDSPVGNLFKQPVREVWFGEEYARFRRELARHHPAAGEVGVDGDQTVMAMCGGKGTDICPVKSFYYRPDVGFMRELNAAIRS